MAPPRDVGRLDKVAVGNVLRQLRERLPGPSTQEEISLRLGLSKSGYGHYERGNVGLSISDLPRFATALDISLDEMVERLGLVPIDDGKATLEILVRDVRRSSELDEDDKDFLIRTIERSKRVLRGEPDPGA